MFFLRFILYNQLSNRDKIIEIKLFQRLDTLNKLKSLFSSSKQYHEAVVNLGHNFRQDDMHFVWLDLYLIINCRIVRRLLR